MILHGAVKSQDTIVKKGGATIIVKIMEITPKEIKYKRFDLPDSGPLYVELKSNILKIKYANGVVDIITDSNAPSATPAPAKVEDNNRIERYGARYRYKDYRYSEKGIQAVLLDTKDDKIVSLVKEARAAKSMQFMGFLGIPLGIAGAISGLYALILWDDYYNGYGSSNTSPNISGPVTIAVACEVAAIACPIIAASYKTKRTKCNEAAINLFNQKYGK